MGLTTFRGHGDLCSIQVWLPFAIWCQVGVGGVGGRSSLCNIHSDIRQGVKRRHDRWSDLNQQKQLHVFLVNASISINMTPCSYICGQDVEI